MESRFDAEMKLLTLPAAIAVAVLLCPSGSAADASLAMLERKDPAVCSLPQMTADAEAGLRQEMFGWGMREIQADMEISMTPPLFEAAHPDREVVYCSTNVTLRAGPASRTYRFMLEAFVFDSSGNAPRRFAVGTSSRPSGFYGLMGEFYDEWKASKPAPFVPPR